MYCTVYLLQLQITSVLESATSSLDKSTKYVCNSHTNTDTVQLHSTFRLIMNLKRYIFLELENIMREKVHIETRILHKISMIINMTRIIIIMLKKKKLLAQLRSLNLQNRKINISKMERYDRLAFLPFLFLVARKYLSLTPLQWLVSLNLRFHFQISRVRTRIEHQSKKYYGTEEEEEEEEKSRKMKLLQIVIIVCTILTSFLIAEPTRLNNGVLFRKIKGRYYNCSLNRRLFNSVLTKLGCGQLYAEEEVGDSV